MAENMVIAAESLGMGSCFLGMTPYRAERIQKQYQLPKRVFPLVELVMGYPAEEFPAPAALSTQVYAVRGSNIPN